MEYCDRDAKGKCKKVCGYGNIFFEGGKRVRMPQFKASRGSGKEVMQKVLERSKELGAIRSESKCRNLSRG